MTDQENIVSFKGLPVVPGIGIGKVYLIDQAEIPIPRYKISGDAIEDESKRFLEAIERVRTSFETLKSSLLQETDPRLILQTQLELLQDDQLIQGTLKNIQEQHMNAEWSLLSVWREIRKVFMAIEDEYIRSRMEDIYHIYKRIIEELVGASAAHMKRINEDTVIVAKMLAPDLVIELAKIPIAGLVTEMGSQTSHAAIIAKSFGIPTIMGIEGITLQLTGGEPVIIDGNHGHVIPKPSEKILAKFVAQKGEQAAQFQAILAEKDLPAVTTDGHTVELLGNIELPEETESVVEFGATGVGLYRTEYLFLQQMRLPSLAEMTDQYAEVVKKLNGKIATFRTIDLGADKLPAGVQLHAGDNPAMGLRGIRYSLANPATFQNQIRAILRASTLGPVQVMLPMISSANELFESKELIHSIAASEGIAPVPIGVMIETPSSVMIADILAQEADFFSIGTNDLIQYSLAIDRTDDTVAYLYTPYHLAILRMLRTIINAARIADIPVGVCGAMASDPAMAAILIGMGVKSLSMPPLDVPRIKATVRRISLQKMKSLTQGVLALRETDQIRKVLQREIIQPLDDALGTPKNEITLF